MEPLTHSNKHVISDILQIDACGNATRPITATVAETGPPRTTGSALALKRECILLRQGLDWDLTACLVHVDTETRSATATAAAATMATLTAVSA